jgi:uncharacterized cupin superfamily protein
MKQITPQIWTWSQYQPERRLDRNGHFVQRAPGEAGVLIDPVPFREGDEGQVREYGGVAAVVVTGAPNVHAAADAARVFRCPILAPRPGAAAPGGVQVQPIDATAGLPADLRTIALPSTAGGEIAFYHGPSSSLLVGSALVGAPAGQVSLPSSVTAAEAAGAARGLRALLARPFARLLLGEGDSLLRDPVRALQDLLYRHDPAAFLLRQEELHWREPFQHGQRFREEWADCSRLLGLTAHDFDLCVIPPGRMNFPLHRHDGNEELYYVVAGQGVLRTEQGTFAIAAGDVFGFPPRYQIAHQICNTGEGDLRFLSFSAPAERLEMMDYPESGQRAEGTTYGKRRRFFLPERVDVGYWEGTPTD